MKPAETKQKFSVEIYFLNQKNKEFGKTSSHQNEK